MNKRVLGSLARIADFDSTSFDVQAIPRADWETGDYVQGEVFGEPTRLYTVECTTGEMIGVDPGDRVIGAFGHRAATLEGVAAAGGLAQHDLQLQRRLQPQALSPGRGRGRRRSPLPPRAMVLQYAAACRYPHPSDRSAPETSFPAWHR